MLTDEEIMDIRNRAKLNSNRQIDPLAFARDIERAVIAKAIPMPKQEPVGYAHQSEIECIGNAGQSCLILRNAEHEFSIPVFVGSQPAQAAAIPDKQYDINLIHRAARHLEAVMDEHPYCDHVQVVKHFADIRLKERSISPSPKQSNK